MSYQKFSTSVPSASAIFKIPDTLTLKTDPPSDLPEVPSACHRVCCLLFSAQQYDFKTDSNQIRKGTSLKFCKLQCQPSNLTNFVGFQLEKCSVPFEVYAHLKSKQNLSFPQVIFIDFNKDNKVESVYL